jgi:hypothetical protein
MSSKTIDKLKTTIFSKNNTSSIYLSLIKSNNLKLDSDSKSALTSKIVSEMKNAFSMIKIDRVTPSNFNQIVTGVNKKVGNTMSKFLSDPRNISAMNEHKRRVQIADRPEFISKQRGRGTHSTDMNQPIQREQYETDFNSGGQHSRHHDDDSEESITDRLRQITNERAQEYNGQRERPPTPDFSLEKKSKKQKEEERREKEQSRARKRQDDYDRDQDQGQGQGQRQRQSSDPMDEFYGSNITKSINQGDDDGQIDTFFNPITESFINSQDVDYEAAINPFENNVNTYNTGVNPDDKDFDDQTPLDVQMREYEAEGENLINNKKGRGQNGQRDQNGQRGQQGGQQIRQQGGQQWQQQKEQQREQQIRQQREQQMHQHREQQMHQQREQQMRQHQQPIQQYQQPTQQYQQPVPQYQQPQYQQLPQNKTLHPQIQQHIAELLQQQENKHQIEIGNLKTQMGNSAPEQNNQIQLLNYELSQQKLLVVNLQEKMKSSKLPMGEVDGKKLILIEEKKKEIIQQMANLKNTVSQTQIIITEQNKNKEIIDSKMIEMKATIGNNLALYNNVEKNEIVNINECDKNNHIYRYTLDNPINILTSLEINNYSFPTMLHNINPYNNTLYIVSENSNEVICDEHTSYKHEGNMHKITIVPGNYTIEYLVECLNKLLSQIDITIVINTVNNYISIQSNQTFTLITDYSKYKSNILSIFGFNDKVLCNNEQSYVSDKSYDLRSDNVISLYITNISSKKAFCKFNIASNRMFSHIAQMSKPLNNVTHFDLDFRDSNNNPIYFANKSVVIDLSIKSIQTNLPIVDVKEYETPCLEKDLHEQISEMMNFL